MGTAVTAAPLTATSRSWSQLDVFFTTESGSLAQAAWNDSNKQWVLQPITNSASWFTHTSAVSRSPWNLDVFFIDENGVETANFTQWDGPTADTWVNQQVLSDSKVSFSPGDIIAATARAPAQLDIFDYDGAVWWTESWSGGSWGYKKN